MIGVGLTLQPEHAFLELLDGVIRHEVDYYEVSPETLWWQEPGRAELLHNGYHRRLQRLLAETGRPLVGHGVGLSLGGASREDGARRRLWLRRIAEDHRLFNFQWYTDHLALSAPLGQGATLPLPLWQTGQGAKVVRRGLRALQAVVPRCGVENTVVYFALSDPLAEPAFLRRVLRGEGLHLVLDLHNVYTMARNFGFAAREYLARLERAQVLRKVIEVHVSGGVDSDAAWLPSGRVLRLDSHDDAVPEEVWRLLEEVWPRCVNLRGVTLERMEGTVGPGEVALIREELARARRIVQGRR